MAGLQENREKRLIAERLMGALQELYKVEHLVIIYIPRGDDIVTPDEHHIVTRRTLFGLSLPLWFGRVVCRYGHGPCEPQCIVYEPKDLQSVRSIVSNSRMVVRDELGTEHEISS